MSYINSQVQFKINEPLLWKAFKGASGVWIAVCDALRLTIEGDTWRELQDTAAEAAELLFEDLLEDGELEPLLERLGWEPINPLPEDYTSDVVFDIPLTYTLTDEGTAIDGRQISGTSQVQPGVYVASNATSVYRPKKNK